ncbi:muramidase family protein [Microbacterium soli]|uniref:LysM domain-containing protein n=1 Tax=Microbacterium soli TaxID=446075 RepID=A0ABP7NE78_9MICO
MHNRSARARSLRLGAPAAVIGTLAAVLTAVPTEAEEPVRSAPASVGAHEARAARPAAPRAAVSRPASTVSDYVVRPGDTVSGIAIRHGLRPADVLGWNGLGWRSVIHPGQTLRLVPGAAPAAAAATSPAPPAATVHTVAPGDTVYAIARRYGTTVDAVITANGLGDSALIHPGQHLRVPGATTAGPAPTAAPAAQTHRVVAGDTLFGIARKHGTSVAVLMQANGLRDGSIIYPGQTLRLSPASTQRRAVLDATQRGHAQHIIRVGRELGVPDRGIAIALATAMVESSLRNLDHGDRDSLGLFQQRPSQGWGTPAQIMDADRSIRVFYGGGHDPNGAASRGLLDVTGWQHMPFTQAAQTVQVSAYPERYGQWEQQATEWVAALG